jgi:hypothetical protein
MSKIEQEDNGREGRFVIYDNDEFAGEMSYTWAGKTKFIIEHTRVGEQFGGKGFGKQLLMKAIGFARENNLKILPLCSFAKNIFDTDERINDVRY